MDIFDAADKGGRRSEDEVSASLEVSIYIKEIAKLGGPGGDWKMGKILGGKERG